MLELTKSGLPVYLDEESNVIAISARLPFLEYSRKLAGAMKGLFANETNLNENEPVYDVYRGLSFPEDNKLLNKHKFRYDFTVILPGDINGERKKTSGHYHEYNAARTNTYAEVYEVIKGTALYVLQRVANFDTEPMNVKVDDIILVQVEEGQSVIIPPNYGHCSVNIGEGPLIFSNLAYIPCNVLYNSVLHYHGMGYYIKNNIDKIEFEKNTNYSDLPKPKLATVRENPSLGIKFGLPVYHSFLQNPDLFGYLGNPDKDLDAVMDMLVIE